MEHIYNILENDDECQWSFEELSKLTYVPTIQTIKIKLQEKYGDNKVIASNHEDQPMVCFHLMSNKLLTKLFKSS